MEIEKKMETRIEKILPDFKPKEKKEEEDKIIKNLEVKDRVVWKQLDRQAHNAWDNLENAEEDFRNWVEQDEEIKRMVVSQKAFAILNCISSFLIISMTKEDFIAGILKRYLRKIEIVREELNHKIKEKEREIKRLKFELEGYRKKVERREGFTAEGITTTSKFKKRRNWLIWQEYQKGTKVTDIAKDFGLDVSTVSKLLKELKEKYKEKKEIKKNSRKFEEIQGNFGKIQGNHQEK